MSASKKMTDQKQTLDRLIYRVIGHGLLVLLIGLVAGVMLIFSLLDAVTLLSLIHI